LYRGVLLYSPAAAAAAAICALFVIPQKARRFGRACFLKFIADIHVVL
jgi:hypothetical protein